MIVKNALSALMHSKTALLYFGLACALTYIALHQWSIPDDELIQKQNILAIRAIGDELLRDKGDFRTPVPPVDQLDSLTYSLQFAYPVAINPDKLVAFSMKHLNADISPHSIVSVREVQSGEMVYGFELNHRDPMDIPCLGRDLPPKDYRVEVSFYERSSFQLNANAPALGLAGASLMFFTFFGFSLLKRPGTTEERVPFQLDSQLNMLTAGEMKIQLTEKEMQILRILYDKAGQLVPREYLMQEVWLKNGVVTSRSLDMYISRLRKKMAELPSIQIENRHGKGYLLRT